MHVSIRQISTYAAIYTTGYSLWGISFIWTHEFLCRVVFKVEEQTYIYIYSLKHKHYVNTILHISFFCFLRRKMEVDFYPSYSCLEWEHFHKYRKRWIYRMLDLVSKSILEVYSLRTNSVWGSKHAAVFITSIFR